MSTNMQTAQQHGQHWANNEWAQRFARFGYLAKGIVYLIIGILAAQAAVGRGGATTDREGALVKIIQQPFGQVLLGIIAVGLISYSLWNLARAILNLDDLDTDAKGIGKRIWYAVIAISYGTLAWTAIQMIIGSSSESGGNSTQDWTAKLLSWPFGQFLVIVVGLAFAAAALFEFYKSYSTKFTKKFNLANLDEKMRTAVIWLGRIGLAARGIVFGIIAYFLIMAAVQHNPDKAKGLGGALQQLAQQPYGPWLLLAVALGVVAYGLYAISEARFRRLGTNS